MQTKTIKKVLKNKLEEWLSSIENKELARILRSNILVSGGSIASMFLGEDINDFDIYIKNREVLHELILYYIKEFDAITLLNGNNKSKLESQYDGDLVEDNNSYAVSLRTLKKDQLKLYFKGEAGYAIESKNEQKENIKEKAKYRPVYFSPNAISLSDKIQIVIRFFGDNEEIHKSFDFVHATNYFTFDEGLVTNTEALESLLTKQLRYQGSLYPLTSIIRMKKFILRRWNINAGEILKILFQVGQLDLMNPDVLEEQLIGVDVAYFALLIDILRNENPEEITSEYLNTIIDKVFSEAEELL